MTVKGASEQRAWQRVKELEADVKRLKAEHDSPAWIGTWRDRAERAEARLHEVESAARCVIVEYENRGEPERWELAITTLREALATAQPEEEGREDIVPLDSPDSVPKQLREFEARDYVRKNRYAAQPEEESSG